VSVWAELFLGVIAAATVTMAVVQIAIVVAAGRLARRVDRLADRMEHELVPLFTSLNAIGRDASRAAALASAQVERVDRLFADLALRVEETVSSVQTTVLGPAREGRALLRAFRAGFATLRSLAAARRARRGDDEDALFI